MTGKPLHGRENNNTFGFVQKPLGEAVGDILKKFVDYLSTLPTRSCSFAVPTHSLKSTRRKARICGLIYASHLLKTEALSKASNIYYTPGHENGHSKPEENSWAGAPKAA